MNKIFFSFLPVSVLTCCSFLTNIPVTAQSISSDGTLPTPTEVTPTEAGVEIKGGTTREGNLFHSFKDFSVPSGSEAFFNNAPDVVNILNRVTGGNISNIDGFLRANGNANLFLINPAGIVFGAGARLDIGGSFYGSTADSILFPDGVEFSATDTEAEPILTINAPIGLGFRDNPGDIINRSNANKVGLSVAEGKSISLIGGKVSIEQGGIVFAPGGRVELGGLTETGTVNFNNDGSLTFPNGIARGDVSLTDSSIVAVFSGGRGSIGVNARNLTLSGGSELVGGIRSNLGSVNAQAGNLIINASDSVAIDDSSIYNSVESNAVGNGGDLAINTSNLSVTNGGSIFASTFGQGNAGDLIINASDSVTINGESSNGLGSRISNLVGFDVVGEGGDLAINTSTLSLTNGGRISASSFGQGKTGNVTINASDSVAIDGEGSNVFGSSISNSMYSDAVGKSGDLAINLTFRS